MSVRVMHFLISCILYACVQGSSYRACIRHLGPLALLLGQGMESSFSNHAEDCAKTKTTSRTPSYAICSLDRSAMPIEFQSRELTSLTVCVVVAIPLLVA